MSEIPVIQILEKKNYFKQALVPYPNAKASLLPPLGASSLRVRTEVLCVTSNNFTYCKLGELFNWWNVHPLPPDTPAPYSDPATYGRINAWGYARVQESTFAAVPAGSFVYGYLPIGTLPLDFQVKQGVVPNQIIVTEPYRQQLMPVYNRYTFFPATLGAEIAAKSDGVAYDSLFKVMHLTAYLMAQFMYSPDPSLSVNLKTSQADLMDATVVAFAPGSKVGLAFAYLLRNQRDARPPRRLIGAASEASQPFVKETGLYDSVVPTTASAVDTLEGLGMEEGAKVVIYDFGGRAGVAWKWATEVAAKYPNTRYVVIGMEVSDPATEEGAAKPEKPESLEIDQVMADTLLTSAIGKVGEKEFFEGLDRSWEGMRKDGIEGFKVNWGEGMESVKEGWDRFARNEVTAAEGLVFKL
ncbi:hypothetical protein F4805DRAFT_426380 [Annulohypoxylon moriforme]|nr:hypothetical protein F4805DRAFT_426380 [Annulohypoxylon moriforme]